MIAENLLMGKNIALLGGQGARPEARQKLIDDLALDSLEWVFGEKGTMTVYGNFIDSLYPGKYDYIFVLIKFISHKVYQQLRVKNLHGIPLVLINGSYNAPNFIYALFEQGFVKPEQEVAPKIAEAVNKVILEPALPDHSTPVPATQEPEEPPQELTTWQTLFPGGTPEKAKERIDARIASLEDRVAKLKQTQQDPRVFEAIDEYHLSVIRFLDNMPVPHWFVDANEKLIRVMKKHDLTLDADRPKPELGHLEGVMRSNVALSQLFVTARALFNSIIEKSLYDRHGACIHCKRYKEVGCRPECVGAMFKFIVKDIESTIEVVKIETPEERKSWFKQWVGGKQ